MPRVPGKSQTLRRAALEGNNLHGPAAINAPVRIGQAIATGRPLRRSVSAAVGRGDLPRLSSEGGHDEVAAPVTLGVEGDLAAVRRPAGESILSGIVVGEVDGSASAHLAHPDVPVAVLTGLVHDLGSIGPPAGVALHLGGGGDLPRGREAENRSVSLGPPQPGRSCAESQERTSRNERSLFGDAIPRRIGAPSDTAQPVT